MKSPVELKATLKRQWQNPNLREARLLSAASAWPIQIPIGRPAPGKVLSSLDEVKRHVETWRMIKLGEVIWKPIRYRATAEPIDIPVSWKLDKPSEWIEACGDTNIRAEFETLAELVKHASPEFHSLLVRRRSLWLGKSVGEVQQALRLGAWLTPGCAQGRPLRTLSMAGIDTKFFERHASLLTTLLDARFDGEVSRMGLEDFLGAFREGDHWLLVIDLDGSLLPFKKMRVRSSELKQAGLLGRRLLIVENEACQHQLPEVPETITVLGAGFDLSWTEGQWLADRQVAYWGDIDTWGLQFLARARTAIPHLEALLMTERLFNEFAAASVPEPIIAGTEIPSGLTSAESTLYHRLQQSPRGRLEQEFLPPTLVQAAILAWAGAQE
ncbi:MAG: DUF3322 domain-containing protein [Pirellulaceae bacterium]